MEIKARAYPPKEEKLNVISHGIGFILSLVGLILLIISASLKGDVWHIVSFSIYGTSMAVLYLASTLFHSSKKQHIRNRLNVFDHASIYLLIAGTYTPFLLVTLRGPWGWSLFGIIWGMAAVGIVLKLFYTGRYNVISAIAYVVMGWVILIAIKPLISNLETAGLWWLVAGGISYSLGVIFYLNKKIKYNHAIFHLFVLAGSICHFISVFWYVL